MNTKSKATLAYVLITAATLSLSFMVYASYLNTFNFGFALAIFSFLSAITLKFCYLPIQTILFTIIRSEINHQSEVMSLKEAISRKPYFILAYGILSGLGFSCLLASLKSIENAFLFILFGAVGRLIQVPIASIFLGEKVGRKGIYYLGMIISCLGTIIYQYYSKNVDGIHFNGYNFGLALIYLLSTSINSVIFKYATLPQLIGEDKYVPVKTASVLSQYIESTIGLIIGLYLYINSTELYSSLIPNLPQALALILIGTIVPVLYTLSAKLTNIIDHTVARAADGFRIVLGAFITIAVLYFNHQLETITTNAIEKGISLSLILVGTFIAYKGKPGLKK